MTFPSKEHLALLKSKKGFQYYFIYTFDLFSYYPKQEEQIRDPFFLVLSAKDISTIQRVHPSFHHRDEYIESEPEQALEY